MIASLKLRTSSLVVYGGKQTSVKLALEIKLKQTFGWWACLFPLYTLHRVGRTGRAGNEGFAFTFITKEQVGKVGMKRTSCLASY